MDPDARFEYDLTGIYEIHKYTLRVCNMFSLHLKRKKKEHGI